MFKLPLKATEQKYMQNVPGPPPPPPASVGLGLIIIKLDYLRINAYTK